MTTTLSTTAAGLIALLLVLGNHVKADGMVPDTSVVIVYEADGEAAVSVTNTDSKLSLLHVTLQDIPEDTEPLLVVTPPLSRVEASKSQLVRFILQTRHRCSPNGSSGRCSKACPRAAPPLLPGTPASA